MRYLHTLSSYVPTLVVSHVVDEPTLTTPSRQTYETVCLFCDVSGFTKLAETMAMSGKGAEGLKRHLNSYFEQMARIIAKSGGDIFKARTEPEGCRRIARAAGRRVRDRA